MAYLNTTFAPTLFDRARDAATAAKTWWAEYRLIRETYNELSNLSDRDLADLGLHRSQLASVAREAARG